MIRGIYFTNTVCPDTTGERSSEKEKLVITFILVTAGFFICYAPFAVFYNVVASKDHEHIDWKLCSDLSLVFNFAFVCSLCLNPILYAFLSWSFQEGFKRIIFCCEQIPARQYWQLRGTMLEGFLWFCVCVRACVRACVRLCVRLITLALRAGAYFSKVPKSFRTRKATSKISNLKFTELFFSHISNMNKVSLHAKFHLYFFVFKIQTIKNWFRGSEKCSGLSRNWPPVSIKSPNTAVIESSWYGSLATEMLFYPIAGDRWKLFSVIVKSLVNIWKRACKQHVYITCCYHTKYTLKKMAQLSQVVLNFLLDQPEIPV